MSVADVLIAARKKIEREECWTQGTWARDEAGSRVSSTSDRAVCWCALGAVNAAGGDERICAEELEKHLTSLSVAMFNDHPNTTHADVLALFDRAIQLAKEQTP